MNIKEQEAIFEVAEMYYNGYLNAAYNKDDANLLSDEEIGKAKGRYQAINSLMCELGIENDYICWLLDKMGIL